MAPPGPVRWLTTFLDRPAAGLEETVRFWEAVTGTTRAPASGERDEFTLLLPAAGDPYVGVQCTADGSAGSHVDVHVDDIDAFAEHAVTVGAERVARLDDGVVVLRSPAGFRWCVVAHRGEAVVPPAQQAEGHRSNVDQLCIDVPADRFDEECGFWVAAFGGRLDPSSRYPEFTDLQLGSDLALTVLLQRRGDSDGPAAAHLDVASSDVDAVVARHVALGARTVDRHDRWTVLADPSGTRYCVTAQPPRA